MTHFEQTPGDVGNNGEGGLIGVRRASSALVRLSEVMRVACCRARLRLHHGTTPHRTARQPGLPPWTLPLCSHTVQACYTEAKHLLKAYKIRNAFQTSAHLHFRFLKEQKYNNDLILFICYMQESLYTTSFCSIPSSGEAL